MFPMCLGLALVCLPLLQRNHCVLYVIVRFNECAFVWCVCVLVSVCVFICVDTVGCANTRSRLVPAVLSTRVDYVWSHAARSAAVNVSTFSIPCATDALHWLGHTEEDGDVDGAPSQLPYPHTTSPDDALPVRDKARLAMIVTRGCWFAHVCVRVRRRSSENTAVLVSSHGAEV